LENHFKEYSEILKQYKNIIFYGDSGSGKTFNTIKTIEHFINKKNPLLSLEKDNRLKYISFHKMFSYNEFIEKKEDGNFKNGIFKELCVNASLDIIKNSIKFKVKNSISSNSKIWKIYLGYRKTEQRVYEQSKKNKEIVLGWLEHESLEGKSYNEIYSMLEIKRSNDNTRLVADVSSINSIVNEMKIGDFVFVYQEQNKISDIGIITSNYFHERGTSYPHKRKVVWLKEFKTNFDMSIYDNNANDLRSYYLLNSIDFSDLRDIMQIKDSNKNNFNPYFLIIDNIDKGDIFSIFGESLELLNKDKRDFSITLYQSGKNFSLPQNIYIIANSESNIKDISIKNKFAFIKSDFRVNKSIILKNKKEINVSQIFKIINNKIMDLNKKTLSYGFIQNIKDLDDLYNFWYYQLIPYLESLELDFEQISKVIGDKFVDITEKVVVYHNKNIFSELLLDI
jgi:5-methylcytosine-specific restriction protein B